MNSLKMSADDDIIKRRLLLDGDGMGDDRRLNVLLKHFIKWCTCDADEEEMKLVYQRMIANLELCKFSMMKSKLAIQMNEQEMLNYESLYTEVGTQINDAKQHIDRAKEDLIQAKQIRKHRMEYDQLARVIAEQPDRKKTGKKLEELKSELESLKESEERLNEMLELRKKQFTALVSIIHQLKEDMNDKSEDIVNDSTMETD